MSDLLLFSVYEVLLQIRVQLCFISWLISTCSLMLLLPTNVAVVKYVRRRQSVCRPVSAVTCESIDLESSLWCAGTS